MICSHSYGKWNWSFCVGICMDGTDVIIGQLSGFTTWVKEVTSECETTHCVIHTEMLASQKKCHVLYDVIKIINHIKVYGLKSHLFASL